jgi:hypothetical protein
MPALAWPLAALLLCLGRRARGAPPRRRDGGDLPGHAYVGETVGADATVTVTLKGPRPPAQPR